MKRIDCLRILAELRKDQLVVCCLGVTASEWMLVSPGEHTYSMKSAMGLVGPLGLGLSLALPGKSVWAFDGDGALAMNLGTLLTFASIQPPNFIYFVMANRCYESAGGQPIVNSDKTNFEIMARGAGIENAYTFTSLDDFRESIDGIIDRGAFSVVILEVETHSEKLPAAPDQPIEMTYRFGRYIERETGRKVFR